MYSTNNPRIFLPGLNELRAIAAVSVMIQHVVQFLQIYGLKDVGFFNHFFLTGSHSVFLFFVLSGFLITYLLLIEHGTTQAINIKAFYLRRIFRILPLYYLIVGLSILIFFLLQYINSPWPDLVRPVITFSLIALLLPNLALCVDNFVLGSSQLWSLGVEEQFYLIWPLLMRKFVRNIVWMMIAIIILKVATLSVLQFYIKFSHSNNPYLMQTHLFLSTFAIESMAIGGVTAWIAYMQPKRLLHILFHPMLQLLIYILIGWFIYQQFPIMPGYPELETIIPSIVFALLILNVSCNPNSLIKLRNPVINYLGQISYGIYMFHPLVIFFLLWGYTKCYNIPAHNTLFLVFIYFFAISTTISIAAISYHYFESLFLKFKNNKLMLFIKQPHQLNSETLNSPTSKVF